MKKHTKFSNSIIISWRFNFFCIFRYEELQYQELNIWNSKWLQ